MAQHIGDDNTENPSGSGFPDYFHIVPIARGPDRKKWKAPQTKGWNEDRTAYSYPNHLYDGYNGGICHKQSGTCAIDIDDLDKARELFSDQGLNLNRLLMSGCQISSGRANRSKLLYRLPNDIVMLGAYPRLRQIASDSGMVLEFRCVYGTGSTCQDVAPGSTHPDTNETYKWNGYEKGIPVIPAELLRWWHRLIPNHKADDDSQWEGVEDTPELRMQVVHALAALDPDMSYSEWREVGVALHDTGWLDAFDIWDEWSSQGSEYDPDYTRDKWDDMARGRGIKITKLFALAYLQDKNWDRKTAEDMFTQSQDTPVTIDSNTGQVQPSLESVIRGITTESDANHMERVCQNIAYYASNRAEQSDWLHLAADASRYNLQTLAPMLSQARREMSRGRNTAGVALEFLHLNDSDNPLPTRANAELVANTYGFEFKFNLMSRRVETLRDLSHVPADVRELSHLTDFEDLCMQHRLDDKRIQKHRDRIAFEHAYHPFVDYLEAEKAEHGAWSHGDNDWIGELSASLIVDHDKRPIRNTLLTRWLVSVVAAAHLKDEDDYDPWEEKPRAPRGVLVLQGDQNIGKTSWFNTITPDGMYKEGLQMNLNDMNHMKTATNRLVVEIGEADHVTSGRMANYMKTIIGRSVDEVRLAFQKEEVRMVRRNVFCATVNPAEFLSDDQNTRWWSINISSIDFEQLARVDTKRLWQQVYALWLDGEGYHLTMDEMDTLNTSNEAFREVSEFETWLSEAYHWDDMLSCGSAENWKTDKMLITEFQRATNMQCDLGPSKRKNVLKRYTGQGNISCRRRGQFSGEGTQRWWKMPRPKMTTPIAK